MAVWTIEVQGMAVRKGCARSIGGAPLSSLEAPHRGAGEEPRLERPEDDLDPAGRALPEEAAYWAQRELRGPRCKQVWPGCSTGQEPQEQGYDRLTGTPGQVNRRVSLSPYGDRDLQGRGPP